MSKLFTPKKSRSPHPQYPSNDQIEKRAQRIWKMRVKAGKSGSAAEDWQRAIEELQVEQQSSFGERFWRWTGISEKRGWDLMTGLSIPLLIFVGGSLFTFLNNQQQIKIANEQQKDEVLRNYFDTMRTLLLDKDKPLRKSKDGDESRSIARTLTLTTLRQLDNSDRRIFASERGGITTFYELNERYEFNERKGLLLRFLYESHLIKNKKNIFPILALNEADLRRSNLSYANLSYANLRATDLTEAGLWGANLVGADLSKARLGIANLSYANLKASDLTRASVWTATLTRANLTEARLTEAYLPRAYLPRADLTRADLTRADLTEADLREANLTNAILLTTDLRKTFNLTQQQLEASDTPLLCNVALPKELTGKPHSINPNRDCDRIAEKLAERYPNEFPTLQKAQEYVNKAKQKKWD